MHAIHLYVEVKPLDNVLLLIAITKYVNPTIKTENTKHICMYIFMVIYSCACLDSISSYKFKQL